MSLLGDALGPPVTSTGLGNATTTGTTTYICQHGFQWGVCPACNSMKMGTVGPSNTRIIILTREDIKEAISDWVSKCFKDGFLAGEVTCGEVRVELMFPEEALRR